MSETTFPFATDEVSADEGESTRNKKAVLVAGGVAALVLAAGAFMFLGGGSDSEDESFVVPSRPRVAVAAKPAPKPAAKKLPVAYDAQIGRDPFKALYVVPVAAAAPAGAATTTTSTSGTTATSTGTSTTSTATGTGTTPVAPTSTRYPLTLVSISQTSDEARFTTWSVDGQKTTVLPAQRFGKHGELVVLAFSKNAQGAVDKAILQVGDDSPMEVAVGQSNSVL
jgi:hypothetical protein